MARMKQKRRKKEDIIYSIRSSMIGADFIQFRNCTYKVTEMGKIYLPENQWEGNKLLLIFNADYLVTFSYIYLRMFGKYLLQWPILFVIKGSSRITDKIRRQNKILLNSISAILVAFLKKRKNSENDTPLHRPGQKAKLKRKYNIKANNKRSQSSVCTLIVVT